MNKKLLASLIASLFLIASYVLKPPVKQTVKSNIPVSPTAEVKLSTNSAKVVRVIDGDTIELEHKVKVRYIGIDAPELRDRRKRVQCFAKETYEENKKLVEGKTVTLEKDISEKDKYGRLLRYVYLPQESKQTTSSGLLINDYLVRQGYAHAVSYPPDIKYQDQLRNAEKEARKNNRGLWKKCK